MLCYFKYPFDQFGSTAKVVSPPSFFCILSKSMLSILIAGNRLEKKEMKQKNQKPHNLSVVQEMIKNSHNTDFIKSALVRNPKHSTILAATKKINSNPVRPIK